MVVIHAELAAASGATGERQVVLLAGGALDGELVRAAKQIETLTPLFTKSDPPGALLAPLTWPLVVQLSATFGEAFAPGPGLCAWIEEQVTLRGRDADAEAALSYEPPAGLTPYPWQVAGAAMIADLGGALFTDEPGTGKTITAILGLVEWASRTHAEGPVVVVCPSSVIDPWVEAWRTWAPHVRAVAWRGTPKQRSALAGAADVYVTSYETARMDAPPAGSASPTGRKLAPLLALEPAAVVIDECHLIKNPGAARSKAVHRLARAASKRCGAVVALSGTPITHHPGDLWSSLLALSPTAWPSKDRWVKRYCQTLPGDYREEILGLHPAVEPEFRLTLLGQFRRVAKADVLTQLPPKVYSTRTVDLPREWRKVYDDFESQMLAELPDGEELSVMDVLAKLTHLSGLSSAPADVEVTEEVVETGEHAGETKQHVHLNLKGPSWKVEALLEVMEERAVDADGSTARRCAPIVAFAPSRQLVELAGAAATAAGYRVGYVVGGQSAKERTAAVAAFQASELDLICVTTSAGGVGITLTAARTCVFLQRPWSIVEALQAEDRCHRIGSEVHDSVEVIDVVARNTIDTRVRAVLRERAGQLSDLVQDPRVAAELLGGTSATEHEHTHDTSQPERKAS